MLGTTVDGSLLKVDELVRIGDKVAWGIE